MAPAFSVPPARNTPLSPPRGNLPAGYGSPPLFFPPDFPIRIHPPQNPYNKKSTAGAFAWEKTRSLATLPEKNKTVAYHFGEEYQFPAFRVNAFLPSKQKKMRPRFRGAGETQENLKVPISPLILRLGFGDSSWKRLYIWVTARTWIVSSVFEVAWKGEGERIRAQRNAQ